MADRTPRLIEPSVVTTANAIQKLIGVPIVLLGLALQDVLKVK
jgi:hypothetical protein